MKPCFKQVRLDDVPEILPTYVSSLLFVTWKPLHFMKDGWVCVSPGGVTLWYDSARDVNAYKRWQLQASCNIFCLCPAPHTLDLQEQAQGEVQLKAEQLMKTQMMMSEVWKHDRVVRCLCTVVWSIQARGHNLLWPSMWEGLTVLQPWLPALFVLFLGGDRGQGKPTWLRLLAQNTVDRLGLTSLLRVSIEKEAKGIRGFICLWLFLD